MTNPSTTSASYLKLVSLAIDDAGRFYSVNYSTTASRTFLYRWSAGDIQEGAVTDLAPMVNDKSASAGFTCKSGTLAWDHDQDILYWANAYSANSQSNYLLFFDLETGRAQKTNPDYYLGKYAAAASRMYVQTTGLYIVPSGNSYIHPTDTADRITISEDQLTLLQGAEYTLSTAVYPWNLSDKSVTWTTSDADVVSVDGGRLQALDAGQAVVTATTNAAPKPLKRLAVRSRGAAAGPLALRADLFTMQRATPTGRSFPPARPPPGPLWRMPKTAITAALRWTA
ncbi:MAG: Ig-like domain-containing protein [Oscillospiraceae bacterium]